jgi:hypothetical protein
VSDPKVKRIVDKTFTSLPPLSELERDEWGQEEPPRERLNLGLCEGVGKPAVKIKGEWCCPVCTSPTKDGCRTREVSANENRSA